ncbi:MAG: DUF2877 domain-containing protein [Anaerolineales bacterium]|jgi:hypothetical protein
MTKTRIRPDKGGGLPRHNDHQPRTPAGACIPATGIGSFAKQVLTNTGFRGKLLAKTSQAIYLSDQIGQIVWLTDASLPAHRRTVQVCLPDHELSQDLEVGRRKDRLLLGEKLAIDLAPAIDLTLPSPADTVPASLSEIEDALRGLLHHLGPCPQASGIGMLIPLLTTQPGGSPHISDRPADRLLARALDPFQRIVAACSRRDLAAAVREGEKLLGLGPGLTPSGDDFLGGFLFALHWFACAFPDRFDIETQTTDALLDQAQRRTHPISLALLVDLAGGHGPEPVHTLMQRLLQAETASRLTSASSALVSIGASTGWDLVAGALTGVSCLARQ